MYRYLLTVFLLLGLVCLSQAQSYLETNAGDGQPISNRLDELNQLKYPGAHTSVYDSILFHAGATRSGEVPNYKSSSIQQRLHDIPSAIPLDYNYKVQRFIDLYTQERRDQVARMLGLSRIYFPVFEEQLDAAGLPLELKYLPIVESALNPHARSRANAVGMWQFMYRTGKQYGLDINSFVDERKDPFKATQAAMKYLKDAHDMFGDWLLAIASYNCGAGNVRKAIHRSGGQRNFWAIMKYLPRETRGYVPAFIAATYTFNYAHLHNIYPVYVDFDYLQDTLHIQKLDITLQEIAQLTNTDLLELQNLNPELKGGHIPYNPEVYVLRVPFRVSEYFAIHDGTIRAKYGQKRSVYASSSAYSQQYVTKTASRNTSYAPPNSELTYYRVRSGDVVGTIAERFGVSPRAIADWNNLRRYRIKVGQKLKIYRRKGSRPASTVSTRTPKSNANTATVPGASYHTVRSGETLWEIAKKYPGMTVSKILDLNPNLNARKIDIGQKIRVK